NPPRRQGLPRPPRQEVPRRPHVHAHARYDAWPAPRLQGPAAQVRLDRQQARAHCPRSRRHGHHPHVPARPRHLQQPGR
ncbi:hypothetical protein BN1708_019911, partial [Verticillium longisporum]